MSSSASTVRKVFLGVSGASGAAYARRCLQMLHAAGVEVDLVYSNAARRVLREELGIELKDCPSVLLEPNVDPTGITLWSHRDIGAPPASGTSIGDTVLLVPCSLSTLGGIAHGSAANLIERAAQVALKEGKKLVVVPRETPLSRLHLDHLSRLAWAGAIILPAAPGFYFRPQSIDDLVNHLCAKILGCCGVSQDAIPAWDGGVGMQE